MTNVRGNHTCACHVGVVNVGTNVCSACGVIPIHGVRGHLSVATHTVLKVTQF